MKKYILLWITLLSTLSVTFWDFLFGENGIYVSPLNAQIQSYKLSDKDTDTVKLIIYKFEDIISERWESYRQTLVDWLRAIEALDKIKNNIKIRAQLRLLTYWIYKPVAIIPSDIVIENITQTVNIWTTTQSSTDDNDKTSINLNINSSAISSDWMETEIVKFTLWASYDDLKLTDMYVYNSWTADLSSSIKSISLYDINGNKLAKGSILSTWVVWFSLWDASSFIIPRNTSNSVVVIKAALNNISDASLSNKTISLYIWTWNFNVTTTNWTVNWIRMISQSIWAIVSSVSLPTQSSPVHLVVRSKPVVSISNSATNSTHTVSVTADWQNRLTLTWITLSVSNPTWWPQNYVLYKDREQNGNEVASWVFSNWNLVINFSQWVEIWAWSSKDFILSVSNNSGNPTINAKRIVRVVDLKYIDMMDTWWDVTIDSLSRYWDIWLPSAESVFVY